MPALPSAGPSGRLTLRTATPADRDFLRRVYDSTRTEELAPVPWSDAQKDAFLAMQFEAQDRDYRGKYPAEDFQVVELDGQPVGRIYVHRGTADIELIDVALLPEFRGRGLGSHLMQALLGEADRTRRPVRIYVEKFNRAQSLYARLGFVEIEDLEVYRHMERAPRNPAAVQAGAANPLVALGEFIEVVAREPALRERLGIGKDHAAFAEVCVAAGRERGLAFSADDVRRLLQERHLAWLQRHQL